MLIAPCRRRDLRAGSFGTRRPVRSRRYLRLALVLEQDFLRLRRDTSSSVSSQIALRQDLAQSARITCHELRQGRIYARFGVEAFPELLRAVILAPPLDYPIREP